MILKKFLMFVGKCIVSCFLAIVFLVSFAFFTAAAYRATNEAEHMLLSTETHEFFASELARDRVNIPDIPDEEVLLLAQKSGDPNAIDSAFTKIINAYIATDNNLRKNMGDYVPPFDEKIAYYYHLKGAIAQESFKDKIAACHHFSRANAYEPNNPLYRREAEAVCSPLAL